MSDGERPAPKQWGASIYGIPLEGDRSKLTEDQQKYVAHLDKMQEVAEDVGGLCFAWSALENHVDVLLAGMLEIADRKVSDTLLANIDPRDKMRIAAGIAFVRKVSDEWFEVVKWCLDAIDNDLRPRRNRFVHDLWHVSSDGIKRIQKRTGFRKSQAFQPAEYYTEVEHSADDGEIRSLIADIQKMIFRLEFLWMAGTRPGVDWKALLDEHAPLPPRRA